MGSLAFDLRDVLKSLSRSPGYAITVVVTLALAIGGTTAVFSIVNGVLFKPLAYREAGRLVAVQEVWKQVSGTPLDVNEQHFEYWRTHAQTFSSMAQYMARLMNLTGVGEAAQITVVRASGSIFDVLQQRAAIGRVLTPDDERAASPPVTVISDACWRQRLLASPTVIGRQLTIDGAPYTIMGVLPAGFRLWVSGQLTDNIDAFLPIRMEEEHVGWYGDHNNAAIGRLAPGVPIERAQAELDLLQGQVSGRASQDGHERVTLASSLLPLSEAIVATARRGVLLLFAAIAAVLFIACSNLASLALTRTMGRQREVAIRAALGASRARLVWLAVCEHVVLAAAAAPLSITIAWVALRVFVRTAPIAIPRVGDVALDAPVLAFAAVLTMGSGLIVALVPAGRLASRSAQVRLRAASLSVTSDRATIRSRAVLLSLQVAVSLTLLVVTALLIVSFLRLVNTDRGFDAERVLAVRLSLPSNRYTDDRLRVGVFDRLRAAIHELPGVTGITMTSMMPLGGVGQVNFIVREGDTRPRSEQPAANFRFVSPEFFSTLGVPILRGRAFADDERDPRQPLPVVVSQNTAARLWPSIDAVGQRFSRGFPGEQGFLVVGVVADARMTSLEAPPPLMVYLPYWWRSRDQTIALVRSGADAALLMPSIRRAVRDIDPEIAIGEARPLDQVVAGALAPRRYQMRVFLAFGLVALAIVLVGIYATTAYGVSRRRREMNIRIALGARRADVTGLIVRQTGVPIAAGMLAGVAGAVGVGGATASLLFDVRPRDPLVIGVVTAMVGVVGLLASLAATRQNLVIDPAGALREE